MYNWTQYLKESHSYSKKGNNPAMRFMFYFKKKFSFISSHSRSRNQTFKPFSPMNDFPVIGHLVMRTGLWDRQGANIASRYKEMYGVELFLR